MFQSILRDLVGIVILLAGSAAMALPPESDAGGPPFADRVVRTVPALPPGHADHGVDPDPGTASGIIEPATSERGARRTELPERRPSELLFELSAAQRNNALVSVELAAQRPEDRARAVGIEAQWRIGRFEEALDELMELEDEGLVRGVGISWRTPRPAAPTLGGTDVRIGTRATADEIALDYDLPSGNLFAAVNWGTSVGWTLNRSTDGGASWSETGSWCCGSTTVDIAIVDGYVYIGYVAFGKPSEARLRRANSSTGAIDGTYYKVILDASPATISEIALASNADNFDNRIYYTMLGSDGTLRYFWDESSDGTTFMEISTGVSNASRGLDLTWNINYTISHLFLSYVGTDSGIYVLRRTGSGWTGGPVATGMSAADKTSLSAFGDVALVAYEYSATNGQGVRYSITYDSGGIWGAGSWGPPAGQGSFYDPLVTARHGTGTAMIYEQETGVFDTIFFRKRNECAPGPWGPTEGINDQDFLTSAGDDFAFAWLGQGFGIAYIESGGEVYFDWASPLFYNSFELADFSAWSSWVGTCTLGTDSDGDRLDDCHETDTGVYVSATNTGTDPDDADTDGDYLSDGDEVLGTLAGLNLPGMGTNPLRQDILIEYDWFNDSLECGAHSHRPTAAAIHAVTTAFANATVYNPDGSNGIHFISDYGQGGLFTGGNLIADADGVLTGGVNNAEFQNHKTANFASNRHGYFHYVILPHRYNTDSSSSGQAELPGDDLIVSLYCAGTDSNVANTIMHELGHNLNLRHGGGTNCNFMPNYNSIMNYLYQFPGIDNNCTPPGDGVLNYSIGDRILLDESNLNENLGTCGAPPWDWDGDSIIETNVQVDINAADTNQVAACGGTITVLQDYDDWANVLFSGLSDADRALLVKEVIDCDNPPPHVER